VGHLKPFLPLELIYSGTLAREKEALLKEWYDCHQYMGFSMKEIEDMPVYKRKFFINEHNKKMEKLKQDSENKKNKKKKK